MSHPYSRCIAVFLQHNVWFVNYMHVNMCFCHIIYQESLYVHEKDLQKTSYFSVANSPCCHSYEKIWKQDQMYAYQDILPFVYICFLMLCCCLCLYPTFQSFRHISISLTRGHCTLAHTVTCEEKRGVLPQTKSFFLSMRIPAEGRILWKWPASINPSKFSSSMWLYKAATKIEIETK